MQAAVFHAPYDLRVEHVPDPEPGPHDALLRVDACGVCGSDLASYETGHYVQPGQVMGHEIAATVVRTGDEVVGLPVGTRVAVRPMRTCGTCGYCRSGAGHLCGASAARSLAYGRPGGYADLVLVDDVEVGVDVIPVGDGTQPGDLLWAEPLAVAIHTVSLAGSPEGPLRVYGSGSVGLCLLAAARALGWPEIQVVEPREARRQAAGLLGADAVSPAAADDLAESVAAVDTSGMSDVITAAAASTRPGGIVVAVGLGDDTLPWPVGPVTLRGAFAYRDNDFATAVGLITDGHVRLSSLETTYPLTRITDAFADARSAGHVVKAVVRP